MLTRLRNTIESSLLNYMQESLESTPTKFVRYMVTEIPWDDRMVGLVGPRGIGKSTLVKQQILSWLDNENLQLYVSADHSYFSNHSLIELVDKFIAAGGRRIVIDEIHKYKGWSRELKQIYDTYSQLKIIFTGSSILDIKKGEADLSRRALLFNMQGLSFREYLSLYEDINLPSYSIEEITANNVETISGFHPLQYFHQYLSRGYYPFSHLPKFDIRMQQIFSETLEVDIPSFANLTPSTVRKLKQMMMIISESAPYKPNMLNLSVELKISKNDVPDYLVYLEKTGMLAQLRDGTVGFRNLGKVEKVFIDNPSLMTVLAGGNPNIGNIRETFFFNQTRVRNDVRASKVSDFEINGVTYEIGGASKGRKQLAGSKRGVVVRDDIEYGGGDIVPLWAFGLNY